MFGEAKGERSCPKLHSRLQEDDPSALNKHKGSSVVSQCILPSVRFDLQYMKSE